jgi:hypothetical protein
MKRLGITWLSSRLLSLLVVLLVAACGSAGSSPPAQPNAPTVTSFSPGPGATGIPLNTSVLVTFSRGMNQQSVAAAVTLTNGIQATAGSLLFSTDGTVATFRPTALLDANTSYTATVRTLARDLAGIPLPADVSWIFQTGSAADTTPLTIAGTTPAAGASGVSLTSPNITATASKAVDPATVTPQTFTLTAGAAGQGGFSVSGAVTASGNTVRFTPNAPLQASTTYTAVLTTGVKDIFGISLPTTFSWSFVTAPL